MCYTVACSRARADSGKYFVCAPSVIATHDIYLTHQGCAFIKYEDRISAVSAVGHMHHQYAIDGACGLPIVKLLLIFLILPLGSTLMLNAPT